MKLEYNGKLHFVDSKNEVTADLEFNKVPKKPSDYFRGSIRLKNKEVAVITGSYMGYLDINGERYWDYRYFQPFLMNVKKSLLKSDHHCRDDK